MKIVIWGTGHYCIQIEEYIREEIEILAFVENRRDYWGGVLDYCGHKIKIISPKELKESLFDYCLIAVKSDQEIFQQCMEELRISEKKLLRISDLSKWNKNLFKSIFYENILADPRNYRIDGILCDLGEGHCLPEIQKHCKMYDRFFVYLGEMTRNKCGKFIIDIGANVGDTLAAMWKHTNDKFLCVEPVEIFYNKLIDNIKLLGEEKRVIADRVLITDNVKGNYVIEALGSTAMIEWSMENKNSSIRNRTIDQLLQEKEIEYESVDLLKIDTDGFDADCIFSASKLLNKGKALIYWENSFVSCKQYKKYKQAYTLLNQEGYSAFYIFDNYGNFLCKGDIQILNSVADYMQRIRTNYTGNTISYCDVLACKKEDVALCERGIACYLEKYPLNKFDI